MGFVFGTLGHAVSYWNNKMRIIGINKEKVDAEVYSTIVLFHTVSLSSALIFDDPRMMLFAAACYQLIGYKLVDMFGGRFRKN